MPVPAEYDRASDQFYQYLVDARDTAGLWSTHVTYTMTQGVFQTFRRRLSMKDAIAFAGVLPICLRALFVTDWDTDEPIKPFESCEVMTREVQSLRSEHNFSRETAIQDVARALRRHVDEAAFDQLLAQLPEGAIDFWKP
ncbi:DUF2267 domain-containing protein [Myxacorys almedinensis]|uniref:DUF2267 domain-containing protein n=1 Tax=Myxacorys almedinensis A TaxID=2690445 RepID=A0A8J8CKN0_9CYAN|nr:DUF2267 domain-containing protein [Myxacorys almedinensis]NDJ18786.1 DUF2267 domain-containing protein [Myxacorys almedinensis A]